tara:strand:+ start:367 stop:900 length:534 start_codon:yes stop_codon:yes gene_type:complete
MLKALPEQQMFVERTPRENVVDDYELNYEHLPEIDRYGARSMGTVHPAILGMLQRRTDDYHQTEGIAPNLNLDMGRDEDRTMHPEVLRYQPERSERAGMSIAQGPEFNRRMYDSGGHFFGGPNTSEEIAHNPDRAARGGPFDDSRHASGHTRPERFMTGYGYSPSHKLTHPKMGEYD